MTVVMKDVMKTAAKMWTLNLSQGSQSAQRKAKTLCVRSLREVRDGVGPQHQIVMITKSS